ncbi:hypothetical protein [Streptomyces sp. NPDC056721]|uniref:hypothetical protein n=1 Tax=unclassified Streptomyces TaxID=2593676 RepID=UPI0036A15509
MDEFVGRRKAAEQRRQECPVDCVEPDLLPVQLPLQKRDLMAQGQDLDIFLVVAHRQ